MKQGLIIAIGIGVVLLAGIGLFVLLQSSHTTPSPSSGTTGVNTGTSGGQNSTTVVTPGSGGTSTSPGQTQTSTISVASANGGSVQVNDFRNDPLTATTSNIPDHYFISGGLDPNTTGAPYSIMYVNSDQSFTVSLWVEPIADTRHLAEQDLLQRLGISQQDACNLRYTVLVPYSVSPVYAGKNLGFSFCPGATKL